MKRFLMPLQKTIERIYLPVDLLLQWFLLVPVAPSLPEINVHRKNTMKQIYRVSKIIIGAQLPY